MEPGAALDLAPKLPPGKDRDRKIGDFCQTLAHDKRQAEARDLLRLISDLEHRELIRRAVDRDRE